MTDLFQSYANTVLDSSNATLPVQNKVDAFEFITSPNYMGVDPFPVQRVVIKAFYNLWEKYPPDDEEQTIINVLKNNWKIDINLLRIDPIKVLLLCLGRRSGKCVGKNSKILNAKTGKYITIEELSKIDLSQVRIPTRDNNNNIIDTSNFRVEYSGKKLCYKMITRVGREIVCTKDHQFLTLGGWKTLENLVLRDRIAIPSKLPFFGDNPLTVGEAKILGYMIGDGGTTTKVPSFANTDAFVIQELNILVKTLISSDLEVKHTEAQKDYCYSICRTHAFCKTQNPMISFLKKYGVWGKLSIEKEIPPEVFMSSKNTISAFLNALYTCDGSLYIKKGKKSYKGLVLSFGVGSKLLAEGVRDLLLRFGINARIRYTPASYVNHQGERKFFDSWKTDVSSFRDISLFMKEIGFFGKKQLDAQKLFKSILSNSLKVKDSNYLFSIPKEIWKYLDEQRQKKGIVYQDLFNTRNIGGGIHKSWSINRKKLKKAASALNDSWLHSLCDGDILWDEIISIEEIGEEDTYDIEVPETENFITDNIVVHNSRLLSFIATYAMYELITLGNPQSYYNIMERHPIHVVHIASKDKQAREMFAFTSDNIRRTSFFKPYMDFDKNNMTELRLFTPYDLTLNEEIKRRNKVVVRGNKREPLLPGSLLVESITTSGATSRGKCIYLLMFSELAHFLRTSIDITSGEDALVAENPQSDYAVVKAMTPSVLDFGRDGRIIMESSPREKGGEFYHHYCIGGGIEQENFENLTFEPTYQVIQLSTWEARPSIARESLDPEFRKDPIGALMEFGAHFGNPSGKFISESVINSIPQIGRPLTRHATGTYHSFIALDPGGKAKKKVADTYALAWGHYDFSPKAENVTYWIDGMRGFDATNRYLGSGQVERITVDPNTVMGWLLDLVKDLGGKGFVDEIAYDQFDSTQPVSTLQSLGLYAIETTFTNSYKADMYGNFLQLAERGQVKMYGVDIDPEQWIERWKLEMRYLQQDIAGNMVYFHHPSTGPVRHDDFADVCFLSGTKIITRKGLKDIDQIQTGEEVLTHKGRYRKVINTSKRKYTGKVTSIKINGFNKPVISTPNHLYFAHAYQECNLAVKNKGICTPYCHKNGISSCKFNWKESPSWLSAKTLVRNQQLYYPIYKEIKYNENYILDLVDILPSETLSKCFVEKDIIWYGKSWWDKDTKNSKSRSIPRFITFTPELFRLFGYYIAEGSSTTNQIMFSFHFKEKTYINDVKSLLYKIFGIKAKIIENISSNSCQVYFHNHLMADLFKFLFGKGAANKQIPSIVEFSTLELQKEFIVGYWRGDGCKNKDNSFSCGSISEKLIWQIREMLLRLGINSCTSSRINNKNYIFKNKVLKGNGSIYYMIKVQGEFAQKLADILDCSLKSFELHREVWLDDEALHSRITKITSLNYSGFVYNLQVEEDESYVTQIGAVHNCANLVHRMCLRVSPTKESAAEARRAGIGPIRMNRGYKPVIGKPLWGNRLLRS
jgi:intein/homing endonuclease